MKPENTLQFGITFRRPLKSNMKNFLQKIIKKMVFATYTVTLRIID